MPKAYNVGKKKVTSGMHRHWGGGGGGASLSEIIFAKETAAIAMAKNTYAKKLKIIL